ncbi:hypothetical protein [Larkinella soli]|uniref:hypothetical protein n=1 Tax=Larkinella soli TaxID=1770527 RepID=UPI000FFB8EDB|nr:hypothetical protein [Larkinella soli]
MRGTALGKTSLLINETSSHHFRSISQAVKCADRFFMEGINVQIVTRGNNRYWVVQDSDASQLVAEGYKLLYGN